MCTMGHASVNIFHSSHVPWMCSGLLWFILQWMLHRCVYVHFGWRYSECYPCFTCFIDLFLCMMWCKHASWYGEHFILFPHFGVDVDVCDLTWCKRSSYYSGYFTWFLCVTDDMRTHTLRSRLLTYVSPFKGKVDKSMAETRHCNVWGSYIICYHFI